MDISLDGKVALVTGAGPNIGSGIALMLAKYGAHVACNDVRKEAAEASERRIERNGGIAMAVVGDVTNEDDVKRYVQEVLDACGRIEILAATAARALGAGVGRVDPSQLPPWWRPWGKTNARANGPRGESPTPTDIGHLVAWISSDYARLITGQDFTVAGGARAKSWAYPPEGSDFAGPLPLIRMDVAQPEEAPA